MKCFNRANVMTSLLWSTATCGLVLAVGMPASLNATDKIDVTTRSVGTPTFEMQGVKITATFGDATSAKPVAQPVTIAGGSPVTVVLTATNPSGESIAVRPTLHLSSTAIPSAMSRTMPTPQEVYHQEQVITLAPGETKTVELKALAVMPQNANLSIVMFDGPKSAHLAWAKTPARVGETPSAQAR